MSNIYLDPNHWTFRLERISQGKPARVNPKKLPWNDYVEELDEVDVVLSLDELLLEEIGEE